MKKFDRSCKSITWNCIYGNCGEMVSISGLWWKITRNRFSCYFQELLKVKSTFNWWVWKSKILWKRFVKQTHQLYLIFNLISINFMNDLNFLNNAIDHAIFVNWITYQHSTRISNNTIDISISVIYFVYNISNIQMI